MPRTEKKKKKKDALGENLQSSRESNGDKGEMLAFLLCLRMIDFWRHAVLTAQGAARHTLQDLARAEHIVLFF
jgi:hypothetical protein